MNIRNLLLCSFIFMGFAVSGQEQSQGDYLKTVKKYRKDYHSALLADERSPIDTKKKLKNISYYDVDEKYNVKCLFIRTYEEKPFEMATLSGETKPFIKYGELLFEFPETGTRKISVYQSLKALKVPMYKDHLIVPFKDLTNGTTTYSSGRYIDLKVNDLSKGIVFLDFNKAYNPWCAYSDGFSCPVPPEENHLDMEIPVGELNFIGDGEM